MHPVVRHVRTGVDLRHWHIGNGPLRRERRGVRDATRCTIELSDPKGKKGCQRPDKSRQALHGWKPGNRDQPYACREESRDNAIELTAPRRERRHGQSIVDADDEQRRVRRWHPPALQIFIETGCRPAGTASGGPVDAGTAAQGNAEGKAGREGRLHLITASTQRTRIAEDEQALAWRR